LRTFIVPSTNNEIISRFRTRAAPISGVKAGDAHVHERVMQDAGIYVIVENLADGIEIYHRLYLGHIHASNIECSDFESGCPSVEVDREVGRCAPSFDGKIISDNSGSDDTTIAAFKA
jgi:hypothetical protein